MKSGLLLLILSAALAGCAVAPPASLHALPEHYAVDGRVSVHKAGQPAFPTNFSWAHAGSDDRIDVANSFGQIQARLEMGPERAAYYDANGKEYLASDIEVLSERELGWRLPARGLRFWLLGLADPATPARWEETPEGRVLYQDGWQINFSGLAKGQTPNRMVLSRPGLEVRIALYNWQLGAQSPAATPAAS